MAAEAGTRLAERMSGMVELAARTRRLMAIEQDPDATDEAIEAEIRDLAAAYERFTASFGPLRSPANARAYDVRSASYRDLAALESVDEHGRMSGTNDILRRRVVFPPRPLPERAADAEEALRISLDETGGVDLALVSRLLGVGEQAAEEALGDLVTRDLESGAPVPSEDYFVGDVRGRLEHVRDLLAQERDAPREEALADFLRQEGIAEVLDFRGRYSHGEDVVDTLRERGVWDYMVSPDDAEAAFCAQAAVEAATTGAVPYEIATDRRYVMMEAYLHDLRDDRPLDRDRVSFEAYRHRNRVPYRRTDITDTAAPLREYWRIMSAADASIDDEFALDASAALRAARRSYAAVGYAFASNGGHPEGFMAEVFRLDVEYARHQYARHPGRYGRYASTVCRLAGLGEMGRQNLVLVDSVTPDEIERALRERPEIAEFLMARTLAWCRMPHGQREQVMGRAADYVEAGLVPWLTSNEMFEEFALRRAAALAEAVGDPDRVAELERAERLLEAALPAPIAREEISLNLGSPWVPPRVILEFLAEKVLDADTSSSRLAQLAVVNDEAGGGWDLRWSGVRVTEEASQRYGVREDGTNGVTAMSVISSALRNGPLKVTKTVPRAGEEGAVDYVVDEELTMLAWDKRALMEQDFAEWAWGDPTRAEMLVRRYNEVMNGMVARRVDGSYLTLPGSSPQVELRAHQKDAVARCVRSAEGTLLAHAVGAGKTYEGIAACHEAKRLGRATKPLVAVPNGIVSQWESSWAQLYPTDRVLVMRHEWTRDAQSRQRFWEQARDGEWDGIVVPLSRFDEMPLGADAARALNEERIEAARLAAARGEARPTRTRRNRVLAQVRRDAAGDEAHAARGVAFDQLGVDMLVVDEAHNYKNLNVHTSMDVAGSAGGTSRKARDLLNRCDWLRNQGHGANIVFLTGTPITNAMSELYVMQRYLAPDSLDAQRLHTFDQWAINYGRVTREVEVKPEGGLQMKDRFSRYTNLPELMASTRTFCDLVTEDDLDLDLPEVRTVNVDVAPTDAQRMCMRWLAARGRDVRGHGLDGAEDNMLAIITDGKKVALDPRLLFPDDDAVPTLGSEGKIARCADNVADVWERTATDPDGNEVNGTQLVFCDSSAATGGQAWNAQAALADMLVERGIPRGQIEIVSGSTTMRRREAAFEGARAGTVRVLIGSTATLGTGVSVQDRLAAIHDLDCPWRAADLDQRMGRIRRQGNMFAHADWWQPLDFRYATSGTFDSFLYQTTERKARFVSQVMTNENPLREAPDLSDEVLSLSEMKALVSGDPSVRRRLELENEVNTLRRRKSAWAREVEQLRRDLVEKVRPELETQRQLAVGLRALRPQLERAVRMLDEAEGRWVGMTVGEVEYPPTDEGRHDATSALADAVREMSPADGRVRVGRFAGIDVEAAWHETVEGVGVTRRPYFELVSQDGRRHMLANPCRTFSHELGGPVRQLEEGIRTADITAVRVERRIARLEAAERQTQERIGQTWPLEAELASKAGQLADMPLEAAESVEEAHLSRQDVYDYLCGNARARYAGIPRRDDMREAPAAPVRHRVLLARQEAPVPARNVVVEETVTEPVRPAR